MGLVTCSLMFRGIDDPYCLICGYRCARLREPSHGETRL